MQSSRSLKIPDFFDFHYFGGTFVDFHYFFPKFVDFTIFPQVRYQWGVPKNKILEKRPRESTDLEEYVFLVPKNII